MHIGINRDAQWLEYGTGGVPYAHRDKPLERLAAHIRSECSLCT